jgi:predicted Ser/Thr protein kinase
VRYRRVVGSDREQDLARTVTATASGRVAAAEAIGAELGRYRIERELGAGAMGVVHAAFDPDLERRIALKVLRSASASPEAKDRLMREARAMARLAHPNVVTVHEVGTADGRDFVAMELVHGETLAEWLRTGKRSSTAIIDAFLAAGRGLAAAHAAGLVHRDFKPHNVLRGHDGRIVVTDFGLARQAEGDAAAALETTLPAGTRPTGTPPAVMSAPSTLGALTATGALLGTPAYMAPEQWSGGTVTPATDQFAYCVALWEALCGERPYRGLSREELRMQVTRGPAVLDASKLPRRVRGLLRRGLDPDPSRRWPSMDAVLVQLGRAKRRPGVAVAIAGAVLAAAAALFVATRPAAAPAAGCEPPTREVTTVWSPAIAAEVRANASEAHASVLAAAFHDWQAVRTEACAAPTKVRQAQLQCLDGALERFDALRQAYVRVPEVAAEELQAQMVDPAICRKPAVTEVPRLTLGPTPGVIAAYALYGRTSTEHKPGDAEIAAVIDAAAADPCARIVATLAFSAVSKEISRVRGLMAGAVGAIDQCGDERLRADLLIQDSPYHWELPMVGPKGEAAITQAQNAAARVMQPELAAALAAQTRRVDRRRGQWDEAFRLVDLELAAYRARGLPIRQVRAVIARNGLRLVRAEPGDLAALSVDVRTWRPVAVANHKAELVHTLDVQDAKARYQLGDVATAHADLLRLWQSQPRAENAAGSRVITGEVVDANGRPVAGASIAAASDLYADAVGIGVPMFLDYLPDDLQISTSDAAGRFVIAGATPVGVIAAELAARRSPPVAIADHVKLVLEPTRSVRGKVDLGQTPHTRVDVHGVAAGDPTGSFSLIAPVGPDGSFAMRAPVSELRLGAAKRGDDEFDAHIEYRTFPASPAPLTGVSLGFTASTRTIDVVVRSAVVASLEGAEVILITGPQEIASVDDLRRLEITSMQTRFARPVIGENVPHRALDKIRPGDLVAHVDHAALGDLTICAVNFSGDLLDPKLVQRMLAHYAQLAVKCEHVGPDATVVELAVPPQQRFD